MANSPYDSFYYNQLRQQLQHGLSQSQLQNQFLHPPLAPPRYVTQEEYDAGKHPEQPKQNKLLLLLGD